MSTALRKAEKAVDEFNRAEMIDWLVFLQENQASPLSGSLFKASRWHERMCENCDSDVGSHACTRARMDPGEET